jgi:predicted RNA-binding Zn ribbon-like protein
MESVKPGRVFDLSGGHPALDLVNTLDWRFREGDPEELLESYDDLVGFAEQCELLSAHQARQLRRETGASAGLRVLKECRELREALAAVIYARLEDQNPGSAPLKVLERFFNAACERQKLAWSDRRLHWEVSAAEKEPEYPLLLIVRTACGLLLSHDMEKVRSCGDPRCRWLFLDTSKNHTRRWCNMKVCGNRMKARRFKAQRRA